ncbi:MAG TPA: beta-ketoacyl synthase N-terminal-like domain-containing protein, partial [Pilimelia sp.]|nr:beta-ketoacyl synthase N-terminal-like domain-containing protein [Pilimelia sp.]
MTAVVTGLGVVAPSGVGAAAHWQATAAGELRVAPITGFDPTPYGTALAGQVSAFDPAEFVPSALRVQTDRWTWFALAAARLAFADGAYDPAARDPYGTSVLLASGMGGVEFGQREIQALWRDGARAVTAYQSIAWFYAASTGQVSITSGAKGPSGVLVTDTAGGLDSLGAARRLLRRGGAGAVLAGATEAPLCPYALACQAAGGRLSPARHPRRGYRPFDVAASGYVPAE